MRADVAALFVEPDGPYPELVSSWYDAERDARTYDGDLPVVAHPPCKRWGRFWYADGSKVAGDDGGLFTIAMGHLLRCGGVLEHPEASKAFATFNLPRPRVGAWVQSKDNPRIWTTCVAQRNYGHKARKLTWLVYVGEREPFGLDWSKPEPPEAYLCPPGRRGPGRPGRTDVKRLTPKENLLTPPAFAELLLELARWSKNTDSQSKGQEENEQ